MKLLYVEPKFIDRAWKDGASCLAAACDESGGEITGDQLKMILSRGERVLLRMDDDEEKTVGWGVYYVDQRPNLRALHITNLVAPHGHFERFFDEIKKVAEMNGCSKVRCSAKPAQARLYGMKCGFVPLYTTLEVEV